MTPAEAIAAAQKVLDDGLDGAAGYSCADVAKSDDGHWKVAFARTDEAGRIIDRLSLVSVILHDDGKIVEVAFRSLRPEPDRRPWWRRKRWWISAVAFLLLPVLIPLSEGPAVYCVYRDKLDVETYRTVYRPVRRFFPGGRFVPGRKGWWNSYTEWWRELAEEHGRVYRASD